MRKIIGLLSALGFAAPPWHWQSRAADPLLPRIISSS